MKLIVATPERVVVEADGLTDLRAEDASGWFGLRPGHADLVTVLVPSVITWRGDDEIEHYVAVRGGALTITDGERIAVASAQAVTGDDYDTLDAALADAVEAAHEEESDARTEAARLETSAVHALEGYLRAASGARPPSVGGG